MEKLLLYMSIALVVLLVVATVVAAYEQLRRRARLGQWRADAEERRAFERDLAAQERQARTVADRTPTHPPPPSPQAQQRAVLAGTRRRSARPAVGQPSSGWTETEPMVLEGPSQAHFDPTEVTRPRNAFGTRPLDAAARKVAEPSATADR